MDEKFRKAEEEYFILRGKFDTGRIGKNLFELALKDMAVQDTQGRWWMIGADSGNWYMHDGKSWVPAVPSHAEVAASPTTPLPRSFPGSSTSDSGGPSNLPLVAAIGCVAIICLGLGVVGLYGVLNANLRPGPNAATLAALRSPLIITTPTFAATSTPSISTPAPTDTIAVFTETPFRTRIPTATLAPSYPPGVYVIGMRTDPSPPRRREEVIFYPTFVNSTGALATYRLVVNIYRPDQLRPMGESFTTNVTLPLGQSEQAAPGWRLTGPGGCEDFIIRVGWVDDQKRFTQFLRPNGQGFELPMAVCP